MAWQRIGSFKAQSADGKEWTILIEQKIVPGETANPAEDQRPSLGRKRLILADGTDVIRVSKGVFKILRFDPIEVTSNDPLALELGD